MATVERAVRWCASAMMGGALTLSALGVAGDTVALAAPAPAPTGHWCPGDPWNPGWGNVSDWDWHQCHDWQHPGGPSAPAGWGPWGPPPPWAPPRPPQPDWAPGAQMMWNPTGAGNWGIWNNGIWTPI